MDKNEYNLKLEEIDKFVNQGNYSEAAKVADSVDWRRVRNVRTLCMISEIYEADNRYEDSKALLLRAYRRSPVGRAILYRLVETTIHLKQFDEAIEYYSEYVQAAPHDNNKYILKYKIYRGRGSSLEEQIEILKEYLSQEYTEKWAFELARLYQQAGMNQECLAACDDLVLWFHNGKYVIKALELKKKYAKLTPKQQEIYDHRFDEKEEDEEDSLMDESILGREKQIVDTSDESLAESIIADTEKEIAQSVADTQGTAGDLQEITAAADQTVKAVSTESHTAEGSGAGAQAETQVKTQTEAHDEETEAGGQPFDEPIEDAQAFDEQLNLYNTQELQTELVKSMREIVSGVAKKPSMDEDDENVRAADEVIEQSKQEQAVKEPGVRTVLPKIQMPDANNEQIAGQLSIDDILLSMGERGKAVKAAADRAKAEKAAEEAEKEAKAAATAEALRREAEEAEAKKAAEAEHAVKAQISTGEKLVTEAQDNAEVQTAEAVSSATKAQNAETDITEGSEAGLDTGSRASLTEAFGEGADAENETNDINRARSSAARAVMQKTEEAKYASARTAEVIEEQEQDEEMEQDNLSDVDVVSAPTRRIPAEEIAERHASYHIPQQEEVEAAKTEPVQQMQSTADAEPEQQMQSTAEADQSYENATQTSDRRAEGNRTAASSANRAAQNQIYGSRPMVKEYQKDLFAGFLGIQNMEEQIASAIEQSEKKGDDRTSRTGNILILGGHGCGKTTIATNIAKAIAQDRGSQFVKMARIYASDLNRKDIAATIAKIAGGTLIIEEAGDLDDGIVDQLTTAMEFRTDGLIIILEDEQRYIHDLLMRHPRFTMKFTSQIYIPVFTIDELVHFGQLYAANQDYSFSEGAAAALYDRIGNVSAQGDAVSITNITELVDQAIRKSNKFFRKMASGKKRYDENDCIILQEKDFR